MKTEILSLCSPDHHTSCFACCPPIRPAGYEHRDFQPIIQRILRENTAAFERMRTERHPIIGYSCWALGYPDEEYRLIGCLLHPARHRGEDLRYLVDYGDKCRRESCPEAKTFSRLTGDEQRFWLTLTAGLDPFAYSSRVCNPLFSILGWGDRVLGLIANHEGDRTYSRENFFEAYPFFSTTLEPKSHAYLLSRLMREEEVPLLKNLTFRMVFEDLCEEIKEVLHKEQKASIDDPYVHHLGLGLEFAHLLRGLGDILKLPVERACRLKTLVDDALDTFRRTWV